MGLEMRAVGVLVFVLTSFGCSQGKYNYVRTTHVVAEAKPDTCQPELFTTRPERSYVELGVLEPKGFYTGSTSRFIANVRPYVCAAGGDAVLAVVNGTGLYIRGTVIRFNEAAPAPAPAAATATP